MSVSRMMVLLLSVATVVAACGNNGGGDESAPDTPAVAGVCTAEDPDCEDTVIPGDEPIMGDEPISGDEPPPTGATGGDVPSGFVVDGGLTVPEAIATDATGILAVKGFLFGDATGWRICEVLAESFPPQCGGAFLSLGNFGLSNITDLPEDELIVLDLQEVQGITWTNQFAWLFGEIVDGTFVVSTTVTG